LGWRIAGRHREVGIAAKVSQQADFIVKATPAAIRPRIVQGPVAMDESERQLPVALPQQTMLVMQYAAKTAHAVDKVLATFAIMVKMDFHIRYSIANHFRKWFD
jgi:hypothetical protein